MPPHRHPKKNHKIPKKVIAFHCIPCYYMLSHSPHCNHGRDFTEEGDVELLFTATYENKLDQKGRVSVPARYRASLTKGNQPLYITCSMTNACLDCMPQSRLQRLADRVDELEKAEDRNLYQFVLSQAQEMRPDKEGRVMLTESFIAHASLGETVLFVGIGRMFQIWNPPGYHKFTEDSRNLIKQGKLPPLHLYGSGRSKNGGEA